jgi:hypothetical protein
MEALGQKLDALGHEVQFPPPRVPGPDGQLISTRDYYKQKKELAGNDQGWIWKNHSQRISDHFNKVEWSDAILVTNYEKNNTPGYIGPNTLMEMGLAFHLKKPIFLLNPVPELAWKEEIVGLNPRVIDNDLSKLNN